MHNLARCHFYLGDLALAIDLQRRAASLLLTADENDRSIIRQRLAEYEAAVEGKDRWDLATSGSRVGTLFKTLGARLRVR